MHNKNLLRNWLILFVLIIGLFFAAKAYWNFLLSPVNTQDVKTKRFIIYKGEGLSSAAERLEKEGLIRSAGAFKILAKTSGKEDKVQAGEFKLSTGMSARDVLDQLMSGVVEKWVTLLEGWRLEEMAGRLNQELGIKSDEFLKFAKEGYMFPDTYLFKPEANAAQVTQVLRDNFNQKYNNSLQEKIIKQGLTPDEGVILASIVEREARSYDARKMVASILLKRLKIGMGLNTDATIQYILGYQKEEKSFWKRHLTRSDLKVESPYNTYLYVGLPPAPICNPSLSSLEAVAEADPKIPYLYYYHDSKGISRYGRTLEEHNQNVATYP